MPPIFVVGDVFPIGGVVPGVVLGVVPGVVLGVVPGVVLGVVVVAPVVGIAAGVLGGQTALELAGVVDEVPGMVALGLFGDGLAVLIVGELEVADGVVDVTGQVVEGDCVDVVADPGLVACVLLGAAEGELDCVPGTVGVGVIAPVWGAWAIAIATAKHSRMAIRIAGVLIYLSC